MMTCVWVSYVLVVIIRQKTVLSSLRGKFKIINKMIFSKLVYIQSVKSIMGEGYVIRLKDVIRNEKKVEIYL